MRATMVYLVYSNENRGFAKDLAGFIRKEGFEVLPETYPDNTNIHEISTAEKVADVIIFVMGSDNGTKTDLRPIRNIAAHSFRPIIPIVIGEYEVNPPDFLAYQVIHINSTKEFDKAADAIINNLLFYSSQLAIGEKVAEETSKKLQEGINTYIDEILGSLKAREMRNKWYAFILYAISALILVLSIVSTIILVSKKNLSILPLEKLIIIGIAYCVTIILMISISKFTFTLAKSFMVESVRASDRIHAISFGKFYIKAFNEKITRDEMIKVFSSWNIDNGATGFREQSSDDYDPKLLEKLLEVVNIAKRT